MSKSKLIGKDFIKEWPSKDPDKPPSYIFELAFENGDKGTTFMKDALGQELETGKEYEYELTTNEKGYKNIKIKTENGYGGKKFGGGYFNPDVQLKVAAATSITSLIVAGKLNIDQLNTATQKFFTFLKSMQ